MHLARKLFDEMHEERPLVAAILLQLDLLGDPLRCSVYREEAVEAIVEALDCEKCNEQVQEQCVIALKMLGGCFSYTGEATTENWLLKQAGFNGNLGSKETVDDEILHEEKEEIENWQRRVAIALLNRGNMRFLVALSNSMAKGIPCLARASLVTVAWMSSFLNTIRDQDFQSMACSIVVPQLLDSSNHNRAIEETVLASISLQCLVEEVYLLTPDLQKSSVLQIAGKRSVEATILNMKTTGKYNDQVEEKRENREML